MANDSKHGREEERPPRIRDFTPAPVSKAAGAAPMPEEPKTPRHDSDAEMPSSSVDDVLRDIEELPTFPEILWEIQAALADPRNDAIAIADVIEQDPGLAANVLRLANSAHYGASENLMSMKDAVVRVGRKEIERLSVSCLVLDLFSCSDDQFAYRDFWMHSLLVAETAEYLSDRSPAESPFPPGEAYLAGLLHDIGKLVISEYLPNEFDAIKTRGGEPSASSRAAEIAVLGMDHGEVGARLMEVWQLEPGLAEAARGHHRWEDSNDTDSPHGELVHVADAAARAYQSDLLAVEALPTSRFTPNEEELEELSRALDRGMERGRVLLAG